MAEYEIIAEFFYRAEINLLLCGDPGTSKSQLLQYVYNLVPRGQYTSGKGSSAVGLTAYITKDPETRQLVLQTYVSIWIIFILGKTLKHPKYFFPFVL